MWQEVAIWLIAIHKHWRGVTGCCHLPVLIMGGRTVAEA